MGEGSGGGLGGAVGLPLGDALGIRGAPAEGWVQPASKMSAVKLSARRWAMEIRPERGGRITSLRLDGEELLDQGIGVDQPTADGFVEGGAFGWDEMVPNLEPTDKLPDHGEAWRLPWQVVGPGVMRCAGRVVPWQLERQVELGESVHVTYQYTNAGHRQHTAYWCAHPLFKYEPDMKVGVPVPRPAEGTSTKLFLAPGGVHRVQLGRVELCWAAALAPDVAIWICNGDLGGYRQIAVEPSWTKPDFEPGATYSWWLRIDAL